MERNTFTVIVLILQIAIFAVRIAKERSQNIKFRPMGEND